jgi:hypothetical protein
MTRLTSKLLLACLIALGCGLGGAVSGCGGNSNEAEYLRTTSPGTPAEPESVASRRARTAAPVDPALLKGKGAAKNSRKAAHG